MSLRKLVHLGTLWGFAILFLCLVAAGCSKKSEVGTTDEGDGMTATPDDTYTSMDSVMPPSHANGDDGGRMPEFPWPPPEPTLRYVVPRQLLFKGGTEKLGDVFDRLTAAMERGGIDQWSAYSSGRKGFAVVGRLEHIKNDGTPASPRWSLSEEPKRFSLGEYLRRLFFATPGRYRVVAFIVRPPVPYVYTPAPTAGQLDTLLLDGVKALPESLRTKPATACSVEALVYEFYRQSENQQPTFVRGQQSPLTAVAHLSGAGIWTRQELTP